MTDAPPEAPSPPDPPGPDPAPPAPAPASCGWLSDLPGFYGAEARVVRLRLETFVRDAGAEQVRAWDESIPWLQRECRELVGAYDAARAWTAILEYELPRESRRPDVIVLENGVVVQVVACARRRRRDSNPRRNATHRSAIRSGFVHPAGARRAIRASVERRSSGSAIASANFWTSRRSGASATSPIS